MRGAFAALAFALLVVLAVVTIVLRLGNTKARSRIEKLVFEVDVLEAELDRQRQLFVERAGRARLRDLLRQHQVERGLAPE